MFSISFILYSLASSSRSLRFELVCCNQMKKKEENVEEQVQDSFNSNDSERNVHRCMECIDKTILFSVICYTGHQNSSNNLIKSDKSDATAT